MEVELRALFEHLDRNHDGFLCPDDLPKAVRGLPAMAAWQLVAEMDKSGDGYVPLAEFLTSMPRLLESDTATSDPFCWTGIWKSFQSRGQDVDAGTSSTPSMSTAPGPAPPPHVAKDDQKASRLGLKSRQSSSSFVAPDNQAGQPSFRKVVLRPTSSSATLSGAVEPEPQPPTPPLMNRRSSSKLDLFLKQIPPNEEQIRPIGCVGQGTTTPAPLATDALDTMDLFGQTSNEEPFESPKRKKPRETPSLNEVATQSSVEFDPGMDLFGQPSVEFHVADEIKSPRANSNLIAQSHGIPSEDSVPPAPELSIHTDSAQTTSTDNGDDIQALKHEIAQCLESIKRSCAMYAAPDAANARDVLAALAQAKAMMAVRPIPQFLGAAVKSFDKSSLSIVGDDEKAYNFVSIYHVEQAMKIRAFRKTVLPQVFPKPPANPKQVLADLFPDIVPETIDQMFEACANDLHSCFEVLSGLSDYSSLDTTLSPKAPYLRRQVDAKPPNDPDDEEDLNAPLFDVKGYTKPPKADKTLVKSASAKALDGQYLSIPPALGEDSYVGAWPRLSPGDAAHAFSQFESAQNMPEILAAWTRFSAMRSSVHPTLMYAQLKRHLQPFLSFRQVRIFDILDQKRSENGLYTQAAARSRRVLVVGGGPVGLRTAIEVALLGGDAIVVEKRSNFNREQILHLFPWVVHDLTKLGAKMFYPQFCRSSSHLHIGTRQLQCILLKVALMLGVTAIAETDQGYVVHTEPRLPQDYQRVTAVVGAGGNRDPLSQFMDVTRRAFSPSPAIGAVVTFPNLRTKAESAVHEFSWAKQYNQTLFAQLKDDLGVDVENVVYYREEVHYIVLTPKRSSLISAGILESKDLDSVNMDKLHGYVRNVLAFFQIPAPVRGLDAQLFDFSQTLRAEKAAVVLPHPRNKLFAALVGDALLEPFWPQGLGINRGFLSALDVAFAITRLGKDDDETLLAAHDRHYKKCAGLQLQANIRNFSVEPKSRYGGL